MSFFQFEKPGRREDFDYPDMAKEAGSRCFFYKCFYYDAVGIKYKHLNFVIIDQQGPAIFTLKK